MSKCVLDIRHVTKEYKLYESQFDRLRESFSPFKKEYHRKFYALNDVNIQIQEGEKVGIIGANGAGKSTLLKIITGVLNQTEGEVIAEGKIAALLELGAGFNQDYTGIENIRLNGTLMGYSDEEIEERMQKIIDFADIGDFVDQPVKSYSSGMFVRLAFATQIFSDPDILIVDEALSVGDIRFQQKCYRAMDSLMKDKTVVLVTHDTAAVTRFCQRVIWINHGQVVYDGDTVEGLKQYQEFLINQAIEESSDEDAKAEQNEAAEQGIINEKQSASSDLFLPSVPKDVHNIGTGGAVITHCGLLDGANKILDLVEPQQEVHLVSRIQFKQEISRPLYGLTLKDRLGNVMFSLNSEMLDIELPKADKSIEYDLIFRMPELNQGEYTISVAVASGYQEDHVQLCWLEDICVFKISNRKHDLPGFLYLEQGNITYKQVV